MSVIDLDYAIQQMSSVEDAEKTFEYILRKGFGSKDNVDIYFFSELRSNVIANIVAIKFLDMLSKESGLQFDYTNCTYSNGCVNILFRFESKRGTYYLDVFFEPNESAFIIKNDEQTFGREVVKNTDSEFQDIIEAIIFNAKK